MGKVIATWVSLLVHKADPTYPRFLALSQGRSALRTGYNNPQLNPLIEEASTIYDFAAGAQTYDKIQHIAGQDVQFLYIIYLTVFEVISKKVNGFIRRPYNWGSLKTARLQQSPPLLRSALYLSPGGRAEGERSAWLLHPQCLYQLLLLGLLALLQLQQCRLTECERDGADCVAPLRVAYLPSLGLRRIWPDQ